MKNTKKCIQINGVLARVETITIYQNMGQATTPSSEPAPALTLAKTEHPESEDPNSEPVFYGPENRPTKKAKAERTPKSTKAVTATAKPKSEGGEPRQPRKKRGPARPHRRLDIETINSRISKLEKRRQRAKEQLEDATRHVEGYQAEREFREQETAGTAASGTKE